jgi:hypothetical protein
MKIVATHLPPLTSAKPLIVEVTEDSQMFFIHDGDAFGVHFSVFSLLSDCVLMFSLFLFLSSLFFLYFLLPIFNRNKVPIPITIMDTLLTLLVSDQVLFAPLLSPLFSLSFYPSLLPSLFPFAFFFF